MGGFQDSRGRCRAWTQCSRGLVKERTAEQSKLASKILGPGKLFVQRPSSSSSAAVPSRHTTLTDLPIPQPSNAHLQPRPPPQIRPQHQPPWTRMRLPHNAARTKLTACQTHGKRAARAAESHGEEADEGVYERR